MTLLLRVLAELWWVWLIAGSALGATWWAER